MIPQAIAYAGVAGLPPQYGLYSSFMACFVYTVFGSVKDSAIGPTAIAAILTRENLHGLGPEFAVLLAFLSGCVELIMGILQLGRCHYDMNILITMKYIDYIFITTYNRNKRDVNNDFDINTNIRTTMSSVLGSIIITICKKTRNRFHK